MSVHDGFTLHDVVSYDEKHNEANGEDNRDGTSDNRSFNHGAEGPTEDAAIIALRQRQMRNLLSTLLLSQGTPMLLAGDEFGRTQAGNNNAYCKTTRSAGSTGDCSSQQLNRCNSSRNCARCGTSTRSCAVIAS